MILGDVASDIVGLNKKLISVSCIELGKVLLAQRIDEVGKINDLCFPLDFHHPDVKSDSRACNYTEHHPPLQYCG